MKEGFRFHWHFLLGSLKKFTHKTTWFVFGYELGFWVQGYKGYGEEGEEMVELKAGEGSKTGKNQEREGEGFCADQNDGYQD